MIDEDTEETARILLMEYPAASFVQFTKQLREAVGDPLGLLEIREVWIRYRGWYNGVSPTHSVESGQLIGVKR